MNLPLFGNDKYDSLITVSETGVVESKAQEVSPHSSYSCSGNCGLNGSNQPSILQIMESMNAANIANQAFEESENLSNLKADLNDTNKKGLEK